MSKTQENTGTQIVGTEALEQAGSVSTSFDISPPDGASAYTRALYRKLQEAFTNDDENEAFSLLLKILAEVPGDHNASRLAREVGQRLYLSYGEELVAALHRGNMGEISRLVRTLRLMASDSQLEAMPGFLEAANMVDAEERRRLNINLHAGICRLRETSDLKEREQLAQSIEHYAAQKTLSLTDEQQALIANVHEEWLHFCQMEQWRKSLDEQRSLFRELEHKSRMGHDLEVLLSQLENCAKSVQGLEVLPEAGELLDRIKHCLQNVRDILSSRHRRKLFVRMSVGTTSAVLVLFIVAILVGRHDANSKDDQLVAARNTQDVATVQHLLEDSSLMYRFYDLLGLASRETRDGVENWLEEYKTLKRRLDEKAPQLITAAHRLKAQSVTAEQMVDGLTLQREVEDISRQLKENYNEKTNSDLEKNLGVFPAQLHLIREEVLNRFRTPKGCTDMAALSELYQKYKNCCDPLNVTEEEREAIQRGFGVAAAELLTQSESGKPFRSTLEIATAIDDFRKYSPLMKLDDELLEQLMEEQRQVSNYEALPQSLCKVSDLVGYIALLEGCQSCYNKLSGAVPLSDLKRISGKETDYLLQYKLADYYSKAGETLDIKPLTRGQLEQTCQIFSGKLSIYTDSAVEKAIRGSLRNLLDSSAENWPAGLHSLRNGKYFYLGRLSGDRMRLELAGKRNRGKYERISKSSVIHELDMDGACEAMGFSKEKIESGLFTPAGLMHKIASASAEKYPAKVRAYLFLLAVDMVNSLEPHISGIAFSPEILEDVEKFRSLRLQKGLESLSLGSWFAYQTINEDVWNKFFADIAGHDYEKSVLDIVRPIVGVTCEFAGYVDERGNTIRVKSGEDELYVVEDGAARPVGDNTASLPAYTPLFRAGIAQ